MNLRCTRFLALAAALLCAGQGLFASDQLPGKAQEHAIALVGGDIDPVDGAVIAGGTLIFDGGKIVAIGKDLPLPQGAERVDVAGLHVYPGLIALGTHLGLVEIDAVRATRDTQESGEINPSARAEASINPDSELIPVARANGIALAMSVPEGGLISGVSALIRLDGWTYEEMVLKSPLGVHVHWPALQVELVGDAAAAKKALEAREEALRAIRAAFRDARAYLALGKPGVKIDLNAEALLPCLKGESPVFVHADEERQIQSALDFAEEFGLKMVLVGGRDAARVAERLSAMNVPVIYGPIHQLPAYADDDYDAIFTVPAQLHKAKVRFAISSFETSNVRNLPYQAATAAAFGLPRAEALKAITLYPAQILGVADRVGALKPGMDATLIVTSGDPLEITSNVKLMWIEGRAVDLTSRHTELYKKYRERIRRVMGK